MKEVILKPIGRVGSSRKEIKDDDWDSETAFIALEPSFTSDALTGLDAFSHVEVLFYMDQVDQDKVESTARRPRNNPDWPEVGIFSQRGKNRPNQIGHTICEILEVIGTKLYIKGLDAVDGTPALDLKPWVNEFGPRGELRQPTWMTELMEGYWA